MGNNRVTLAEFQYENSIGDRHAPVPVSQAIALRPPGIISKSPRNLFAEALPVVAIDVLPGGILVSCSEESLLQGIGLLHGCDDLCLKRRLVARQTDGDE